MDSSSGHNFVFLCKLPVQVCLCLEAFPVVSCSQLPRVDIDHAYAIRQHEEEVVSCQSYVLKVGVLEVNAATDGVFAR